MSMSWEMDYKRKLKRVDDALQCVKSGMRVYIQPGCAEPETLIEALMRRAPELFDVEIVHMMTLGCAPYVAPDMAPHFRHNAVFIGANVHEAINDGRADSLHGKSIRERAQSLIEIAHPKFRERLYEYCEKTKWLHPRAADVAPRRV
jgi:acyl-CoA hydrolase